jgi:hypothetical protein
MRMGECGEFLIISLVQIVFASLCKFLKCQTDVMWPSEGP